VPGGVEPQYLYLTTTGRRSGLPREIEIWFTQYLGRYYLISEHSEQAHWVRNLRAEPRVRWRVGEAIVSGRARTLDASGDAGLVREIQQLSRRKYGWGEGLVVELTPDSPGEPRLGSDQGE
jgi:deazaflavin-dependent oxidoreductase (nitroreductase family)